MVEESIRKLKLTVKPSLGSDQLSLFSLSLSLSSIFLPLVFIRLFHSCLFCLQSLVIQEYPKHLFTLSFLA
jgi:hypothetical protein